jgi:hypothetical protein
MNLNEENNKPNKNENNPFSLPEGYFGSFAQKMMHKIEVAEELKEFKLLSSIDKKLPFITPGNYFANSEVKNELAIYPKLTEVKKENAFVVPQLYFESSAKAIENKIGSAEELKAYPALYSIGKENSFTTPQNYFEDFSPTVREKLVDGHPYSHRDEEDGIVRILHIVFSKKTAYAIAAMLVISLGLYFYNSGEETVTNCGTLACLDKTEILKSNQVTNMDEESLMKLVDPEKLSKNLKEASENSDTKQETDYVLENADVNDIVDEI